MADLHEGVQQGPRRRIVISGGSGLLGTHLLPLLQSDAELHLLGGQAPEEAGCIHHPADLGCGRVDLTALPPSVDAIIHLAQSRRFRDFPDSADHVLQVNTVATVELARYAVRAGASTFVYASTGGVYPPGPDPLAEDMPVAESRNLAFYPATKLAAELLLAPFQAHFHTVVLRPFFIYGPGQDGSMLIPRLIESVRSGTPIRLHGANGMRINPIHASDAALAVREALRLEGTHCINVAGPEILSLRQVGEIIGRAMGRQPVFEIEDSEGGGDLIGSIEVMKRLLGAPSIRFKDALKELL